MRQGMKEALIAEFWTWFTQHESDLAEASSDSSPILDQLLQELQRIDSKSYFEICTGEDPHELIVTVEGRQEQFPLVEAVVASAPRLEGVGFHPAEARDGIRV